MFTHDLLYLENLQESDAQTIGFAKWMLPALIVLAVLVIVLLLVVYLSDRKLVKI